MVYFKHVLLSQSLVMVGLLKEVQETKSYTTEAAMRQ